MAQTRGIRIHQYLDDWLVRVPCRETTYPDSLGPVPQFGLGSESEEIRINTSTGFQFCHLSVRPIDWSCLSHSGKVGYPSTETKVHQGLKPLHSQVIHVLDRTSYSNRETGMVRSSSHETHSVASEATLACTRESGKGDSVTPFSPSTPGLMVK